MMICSLWNSAFYLKVTISLGAELKTSPEAKRQRPLASKKLFDLKNCCSIIWSSNWTHCDPYWFSFVSFKQIFTPHCITVCNIIQGDFYQTQQGVPWVQSMGPVLSHCRPFWNLKLMWLWLMKIPTQYKLIMPIGQFKAIQVTQPGGKICN